MVSPRTLGTTIFHKLDVPIYLTSFRICAQKEALARGSTCRREQLNLWPAALSTRKPFFSPYQTCCDCKVPFCEVSVSTALPRVSVVVRVSVFEPKLADYSWPPLVPCMRGQNSAITAFSTALGQSELERWGATFKKTA